MGESQKRGPIERTVLQAHENPFRSECIDALRFRFTRGSEKLYYSELASRNYSGAIVAPHGHGKSTLLFETCKHLAQNNIRTEPLYIASPFPSLIRWLSRPGIVLLVDGIEQLPRGIRVLLRVSVSAGKRILITAHKSVRWLPVIYEPASSESLFMELVNELLFPCALPKEEIKNALKVSNGNTRDAFFRLYDLVSVRGAYVGQANVL